MTEHSYHGGCHCGAIGFSMKLPKPLTDYSSRACDCNYCTQHGAAYLSDPDGQLTIRIPDTKLLSRYRQGSGIADFWVCKRCGVLVAVSYEADDTIYATVNSRAVEDTDQLTDTQCVSPRLLADSEKTARWKKIWFRRVRIET